jgi:hypothetical protein
MDVVTNWALPLPNRPAPINAPVVMVDVVFAAQFVKHLSRIGEKLGENMTGAGDLEWVGIRNFMNNSSPVLNVPTFAKANRGRSLIRDVENDIDIFVTLHVSFNVPFQPKWFSTHVQYAFKGLCEVEANLSDPSCQEVVRMWTGFGQNGFVGRGFSSMGNLALTFPPLPAHIPNNSFLPPNATYIAVVPPPAPHVPIGNSMSRVFGQVLPNNWGRVVQLLLHMSQPIANVRLVLTHPIILLAMDQLLQYPF